MTFLPRVAAILGLLSASGGQAHGELLDLDENFAGFEARGELLDDDNIHGAVEEWFSNQHSAEAKYGKIQEWDTSRVQNFHSLFKGRRSFNEDIGKWNVSEAVTLGYMFNQASSFNQNLSGWDTRKVRFMDGIFNFATSFNGDISTWETDELTSLDFAFSHASSFNSNISGWRTPKLKFMAFAFWNATSFSHDLSSWDVSTVDDIVGVFYNATAFNHSLCWELDLEDEFYATRVFCNSPGSFDSSCGNPELLTKVQWGCLEPQDDESSDDGFTQVMHHEAEMSIVEDEALREAVIALVEKKQNKTQPLQSQEQADDRSEAIQSSKTAPNQAATESKEDPLSFSSFGESSSGEETGSVQRPSSETLDSSTAIDPASPETVGSGAATGAGDNLSAPEEVLAELPSTPANSSPPDKTHSGIRSGYTKNDCEDLKYVAIAFASGAAFIMIFLFSYVTWKRRQIKLTREASTVLETDSDEATASS